MPLLTGAITALTLGGTPGLPAWTDTTSGGATARPYVETFTQLAPSGTVGRLYGSLTKNPSPAVERTYSVTFSRLAPHGTPTWQYGASQLPNTPDIWEVFEGKDEKVQDEKYVTDTIRPRVTEGPVSDVDIDLTEVMFPRVTESRAVGVGRSVSDTVRPRVTDVVQFLQKGGSTAKSVADTITPVVTDGSVYRVQVGVTDTVTPVLTEGDSLQTVDGKSVSDTITLVVTESALLDTSLATRSFTVNDVVTAVLRETASAGSRGEVDSIHIVERPYGRIRITEA